MLWVRLSSETAAEQDMQSAFERAVRRLPDALRNEARELGLRPLFEPDAFRDRLQFFRGDGDARAVGMFLSDGQTFVMYALASATKVNSRRSVPRVRELARFSGDGSVLVAPTSVAMPGLDTASDSELRNMSNWISGLLIRYLELLRPRELVVAEASRLWRAIRFGGPVLTAIQDFVGEVVLDGRALDPCSPEGVMLLGIDLVLSTLERNRAVAKMSDGRIRKVEASDASYFPFSRRSLPLGWRLGDRRELKFDDAALPVIELVCAHLSRGTSWDEFQGVLTRIKLLTPGRSKWPGWLWDAGAVAAELEAVGRTPSSWAAPEASLRELPSVTPSKSLLGVLRTTVGFWHDMEYRGVERYPAGQEVPERTPRTEPFEAADGSHEVLMRIPLPGTLEPIRDVVVTAHEQVWCFMREIPDRVGQRATMLPLLGEVMHWQHGGFEYRAKSQVSSREGVGSVQQYDVRRRPIGEPGSFWGKGSVREKVLAVDAGAFQQFVFERLIEVLEQGVPAGVGIASPFGPASPYGGREASAMRTAELLNDRAQRAALVAYEAFVAEEDGTLKAIARRSAEARALEASAAQEELARHREAFAQRSGASDDEGPTVDVSVLVRVLAALSRTQGAVDRSVAHDCDQILRIRLIPLNPLAAQVHAAIRLPRVEGGSVLMFADLGTFSCVRRYSKSLVSWKRATDLMLAREDSMLEELSMPAAATDARWWRREAPPSFRVVGRAALACSVVMSGDLTLQEARARYEDVGPVNGKRFNVDAADVIVRAALMAGCSLEHRVADLLLACPAADVRRAVWHALRGDEPPAGVDPLFSALVARTYLGAEAAPTWPGTAVVGFVGQGKSPWVRRRGTNRLLLRALTQEFGDSDFSRGQVDEVAQRYGLGRLLDGSVLLDSRATLVPTLEGVRNSCRRDCSPKCRQHLRDLRLARCPHDDCSGLIDVYAAVPELPGRQLCSSCRRMPMSGSATFPVPYVEALLAS
jgi:hypothetical protein